MEILMERPCSRWLAIAICVVCYGGASFAEELTDPNSDAGSCHVAPEGKPIRLGSWTEGLKMDGRIVTFRGTPSVDFFGEVRFECYSIVTKRSFYVGLYGVDDDLPQELLTCNYVEVTGVLRVDLGQSDEERSKAIAEFKAMAADALVTCDMDLPFCGDGPSMCVDDYTWRILEHPAQHGANSSDERE
jgi:hypothetical protein